MPRLNDLATQLKAPGIERRQVILLLLEASDAHVMPKDLRELAKGYGLPKIAKWNVSQLLSDLGSMAARYPDGWAITEHGKRELAALGLTEDSPTKSPQIKLREILKGLEDHQTTAFVGEAVEALEYGLLRSAVVLSWVGAVGLLHSFVANNHLLALNQERSRRDSSARPIKNADGLQQIKEHDFLQLAAAIGIFDKNVKGELEGCLRLRNSCGHPNKLRIGEHKVASHIETLILNVYDVFG